MRLLCCSYTAVHSPLVHVLLIKTLQTNSKSSCVKANALAHLVFPKLSCPSKLFFPAAAQHVTLQKNRTIMSHFRTVRQQRCVCVSMWMAMVRSPSIQCIRIVRIFAGMQVATSITRTCTKQTCMTHTSMTSQCDWCAGGTMETTPGTLMTRK